MSETTAELLSPPSNYCVVQLPGRKYPGVVCQGDSLSAISSRLGVIDARLKAIGLDYEDDARAELEYLRELFDQVLRHYEHVLDKHGLKTPCPERKPVVIEHPEDRNED